MKTKAERREEKRNKAKQMRMSGRNTGEIYKNKILKERERLSGK
jgi:hypothetical protein